MPSRRSLLGSLGVLLTAGCSQRSQAGGTPSTKKDTTTATTSDTIHAPTRLDWGESTTYDGTSVTPGSAWSQHSVITLTTPDSFGVEAFPGRQLLFVTVAAVGSGPIPRPDDFVIEADGERYPGVLEFEGVRAHQIRLGNAITPYDPDAPGEGGWIGFRLPTEIDADDPKLSLQFAGESEGATRWPVPAEAADALAAPAPHTHLDKLEVPESVPADESFDVTLTATNEGKGPGVFRAAVNEAGPQYAPNAVRLALEPGESRTTNVTVSGHVGTGADQTTVDIVTQDRDVTRTVALD